MEFRGFVCYEVGARREDSGRGDGGGQNRGAESMTAHAPTCADG